MVKTKKRFLPGDEDHFSGLLLHTYYRKRTKGRGPGKMLRPAGIRPLI